MESFNLQIFGIQWITFLLGMAAIWVMYLKPLGLHLRGRREGIAKDLAAAEAARAEAAKLKAEFDAEKAKMAEENRRQMEKVKADAEAFRTDLLAKAKAEQDALVNAGRKQIDQERLEALRQIRAEAASLVVQATEKLLEKHLDGKTQEALAKKFIAGVKVSKN